MYRVVVYHFSEDKWERRV